MADYARPAAAFQDSPSTATPIRASWLNGVDDALTAQRQSALDARYPSPGQTGGIAPGWVPITSDCEWPNGGVSSGVASVTSMSRHVAARAATDLRFAWVAAHQTEAAPLAADVVLKAAVEIGGTIYPLYFARVRTVTYAPGTVVVSDPLPVPVYPGDVLLVRAYTSSAGNWPLGRQMRSDATEGRVTNTDVADSGAISGGSALSNPPYALLGRSAGARAVLGVLGASTVTGQGDNVANVMHGWVRRAIGSVAAMLTTSVPGDTAQAFTVASWQGRQRLLSGCSHLINGFGAGDILNGSRTAAQLQADLIRIWRSCAARGAKNAQSTIQPKTTSTDSWATAGNQTAADGTAEGHRVTFNTWLRDGAPLDSTTFAAAAAGSGAGGVVRVGAAGHPLHAVIDIMRVGESGLNSGKWTAGYTPDGLHPNSTGAAAIAADVAADVAAFLAF